MECKEKFSREAKTYDDNTFVIPHYDNILHDVVDLIDYPNNANIKVLDLGCGTGTVINLIKNRFSNSEIYAVDFSEEMLSVAKAKNKGISSDKFILNDILKVNISELPKFDVIISTFVLHNYKEEDFYEIFFGNAIQMLTPDGILIIGDLVLCEQEDIRSFENQNFLNNMRTRLNNENKVTEWLNLLQEEDFPLTINQIHSRLNKFGFNVTKTINYNNSAIFSASLPVDALLCKAELLVYGIKPNGYVDDIFELQNPKHIQKTGNNGVILTLNDKIQVLVGCRHNSNKHSPYELKQVNGILKLFRNGKILDLTVKSMETTSWYDLRINENKGYILPDFFVLEGNHYLHMAYKTCSFDNSEKCKFCTTNKRSVIATDSQNDKSANEVCEALQKLFSANVLTEDFHFCIGGGTYTPMSDNVKFFEDIVSYIRSQNILNPIWVEMIPPSNEQIDTLIKAGVTSFGFNIEIWNERLRGELCPGKDKLANRERYIEALKYANSCLGHNKTGSCIIAGIDDNENLKECIDVLATNGIFPCVLALKDFNRMTLFNDSERTFNAERVIEDFIILSRYAAQKAVENSIDYHENHGCLSCPCCTIVHDFIDSIKL
jgi:tRNA (cmo5U34)-methyltransferase